MNEPMLEKLLNAKKYQDVCPDTVRRVWAECREKYKRPKEAERAAREALHGIAGPGRRRSGTNSGTARLHARAPAAFADGRAV